MNRENLDFASYGQPCLGERVSGDVAVIEQQDDLLFLAMVDVLGHGPEAYVLAVQIKDYLRSSWSRDVVATLQRLHTEIKGSRGAAVGLGVFNMAGGELRYTGVGNTCVRKFGSRPARLYSQGGIVGGHMRSPLEQKLQITNSDVIVLYTDGVQDRFELEDYPQLLYERAATVARNIVRRFSKAHDDATCLVLRYRR